jgi:hypothetical protein
MVVVAAVVVSPTGSLSELAVPAKTADVLVFFRAKLKQPDLQFHGKIQIQNKDQWIVVFGESGSEDADDDKVNQHVLGGNFQDEVFIGSIVMMLSANSNTDNYDKLPSSYTNLKPADYETIYSNWTTVDEDDDDDDAADEDEDDTITVAENDDDDDDDEVASKGTTEPDDDDDALLEEAVVSTKAVPKKQQQQRAPRGASTTADIHTPCPLRELVKLRYTELGVQAVLDLENSILNRCIRECIKQGVDVTWTNPGFWNHYRGRCIQF